MKILYGPSDFNWYKQGLDVAAKYNHAHYNEPERYPAVVESVFEYCDNSRDAMNHTFFYKDKHKCGECGHTHTGDWPERVREWIKANP